MSSSRSLEPFRPWAAGAVFLALLLASGWWPVQAALARGWELGWNLDGRSAWLLTLMRFGPGIAAFCGLAWAHGPVREGLGLTPGKPFFLLPAWLLLPLLAALAAASSVALGQAEWDWDLSSSRYDISLRWPVDRALPGWSASGWVVWLTAVVAGPALWFLPAWAEEIAWRGLLYQWLQRKGFWVIALAAGLLEWAWRLPLYRLGFAYPDHPQLAPWLGLGFTLLTSVLLTWLRSASGAVWAPAVARATLSAGAVMPLALTQDYDTAWTHLQGLPGMALLLMLILVFWFLGWLKIEKDSLRDNSSAE